MSKISCVAARKHDMSCGFANVWGGVLNSYHFLMEHFLTFYLGRQAIVMKKCISKRVDYSPAWGDMDEHISSLERKMKQEGYRLYSQSEIGIYSMILVFKRA